MTTLFILRSCFFNVNAQMGQREHHQLCKSHLIFGILYVESVVDSMAFEYRDGAIFCFVRCV